MTTSLRFLRGAFGTLATWSVGWGVVGTAITGLSAALAAWLTNEPPLAAGQIPVSGLFYAAMGAWSGATFATLIAIIERRTRWELLKEDRFVLLGAAAGASYPVVAVVLTRATLQLPMRGLGEAFAVCVGLGVLSATAMLRLARRHRARAVPDSEEHEVAPYLMSEALNEVERMLSAPDNLTTLGADGRATEAGERPRSIEP